MLTLSQYNEIVCKYVWYENVGMFACDSQTLHVPKSTVVFWWNASTGSLLSLIIILDLTELYNNK